ncbi:MAG TPA: class I SAM-dependent methyltransferase [Planctomycetaceae bacterium]|nr:class I SAM-dependent methyltransferase [Planctomycetaceae bacterium]
MQRYYSEKLREHGPTPAGVDWNSTESQQLRFDLLLQLCDASTRFSLIDYGCGYGALADELERREWPCDYTGFDISPDMVQAAREQHTGRGDCCFTASRAELEPADYAIASGVLNVKLETPVPEW